MIPKGGWTLGARVPVGAWAFTVDVAQDTGDDTDALVYAGYSLSKRTTVYFDYRRDGSLVRLPNHASGAIWA